MPAYCSALCRQNPNGEGWPNYEYNYFDGALRDVRLYARTLDQDEIVQVMAGGAGGAGGADDAEAERRCAAHPTCVAWGFDGALDLCCPAVKFDDATFLDCCDNKPSASPTASPSVSPSPAPVAAVNNAPPPTGSPSDAPTEAPSAAPTASPQVPPDPQTLCSSYAACTAAPYSIASDSMQCCPMAIDGLSNHPCCPTESPVASPSTSPSASRLRAQTAFRHRQRRICVWRLLHVAQAIPSLPRWMPTGF